MSDKSAIEWTEATWNPVTGCTKISPGCANCYAETLSLRFGWSQKPWTPEHEAENVVLHPERLDQPLRWKRPRMVFVNSMSDLFHERIPIEFVDRIFDVMRRCPQHTFQILTKRPERALVDVIWNGDPLPNVWLGVSIENARFTWRADVLREIPAAVRFISAEPLLGSLIQVGAGPHRESDSASKPGSTPVRSPLDLTGIDWLIVGGESGPEHRPMNLDHARELRDACTDAGVAFFFKQIGGRTPKSGGRLLDGREWNEMPVREAAVA